MGSPERAHRVSVTGANGFVGRHLVRHLLELHAGRRLDLSLLVRGDEAGEMCRETGGRAGPARAADIAVQAVDISERAQVMAAMRDRPPDVVFHLAARSSGADLDREAVLRTNVGGTQNVLDGACAANAECRVIAVSSGYVYGDVPPGWAAREEDPICSDSRFGPYVESKALMERIALASGRAVVARPFAHIGPGQSPSFAIASFAAQIARVEAGGAAPILRVGNLAAVRDVTDVRDIVRGYCALADRGTLGEVYNVCSGAETSLEMVLASLCRLASTPLQVLLDSDRLRPLDIARSVGNADKAAIQTGWRPTITLEQTLQDTLDYWRNQAAAESKGER